MRGEGNAPALNVFDPIATIRCFHPARGACLLGPLATESHPNPPVVRRQSASVIPAVFSSEKAHCAIHSGWRFSPERTRRRGERFARCRIKEDGWNPTRPLDDLCAIQLRFGRFRGGSSRAGTDAPLSAAGVYPLSFAIDGCSFSMDPRRLLFVEGPPPHPPVCLPSTQILPLVPI